MEKIKGLQRFVAVFVLCLSARASAFIPEDRDSDQPSYVERLQEAVDTRNVPALEQLLAEPPPGRPLADVDGRLVYGMYHVYLYEERPEVANKALKVFLPKLLALGANPNHLVPEKDAYGKVQPSPWTAAGAILHRWGELAVNHPEDRAEISERSELFFDELIAGGGVHADDEITIPLADGSFRQFRFIQYPFVTVTTRDMFHYLLKKRPSVRSLNDLGWNTAMVIASVGDLVALKAYATAYGPHEAAAAFNFRCNRGFLPTVMHAAVLSIRNGKTPEQVYALLEFLAANGADPDQRSMYHDLPGEAHFWIKETPAFAEKFKQLERLLHRRMPELRATFAAAERRLCELRLAQAQRKPSE